MTLLIDTNVWLGFYNRGEHQEKLSGLFLENDVFISVVTLNEIRRGAHDTFSKKMYDELHEMFSYYIITPSELDWIECGNISERILKNKRRQKNDILLLQNDILIALCAKKQKAKLITTDKHFSLLKPYLHIPIEYW